VLGSADGLINILMGAESAEYGGGAAVNKSQVAVGCVSTLSAAIIYVSKQLGWETRAHTYAVYASHYGELARLISSEPTLSKVNDSLFASVGDLIKNVSAELDRIKDGATPIPEFM
jgi:hypothetical protein